MFNPLPHGEPTTIIKMLMNPGLKIDSQLLKVQLIDSSTLISVQFSGLILKAIPATLLLWINPIPSFITFEKPKAHNHWHYQMGLRQGQL